VSSVKELLHRAAGEELPTARAALASLLGVIAVKDLMVNDVPAALAAGPDDLRLPFFRGLPVLPAGDGAAAACFLLLVLGFVAAIALVTGRFARPAAAFLALLYGWAFLADQLAYTNNVFLFIVLLATCALEPLDPARPSPVYPTWIVRGLVTTIYAVGALVKTSPAWWRGTILGEAFLHYHFVYSGALGFRVPPAFAALAVGSIVAEGGLAVGLWVPRAREKVAVLGCFFHACIGVLLPVRIFSYLMMASYVVFLPGARLQRFRAWRARPLALAAAGVGAAIGINVVMSWLVRAEELPPKNQIALVLACVSALTAGALFPRLRAAEGARRALVAPALRAPLLALLAAIEIFCATKPAFGFTNRFAWRMFTEVLKMRVEVSLRDDRGFRPYVPDGRWSEDELRYHWDSLGEEREDLGRYAEWILAREPTASEVRVVATYERNGVCGEETIDRSRR
jgi:hypothetical protein